MKFTLSLSPWTVSRFLIQVILGLALLSIAGQLMLYFLPEHPFITYFANAFNLDSERNIPTLYSASTLLFCAILLGAIAYAKNLENARYTRHWMILSAIFFYLCVDEAKQLHEKLIDPMQSLLNASGFLLFTWVVPAAIFLAIFGLYYLKFIAHLPVKFKKLFLMAGVVYVGGALGMELLGGYEASVNGIDSMIYKILATIEEVLEMLGIVIFIHALHSYIILSLNELVLEVTLEDATQIFARKMRTPTLTPESYTQDIT